MKPSIGFLGLGIMGGGMCQNLLRAGYPLTIWNRSPAKCAALASAGATIADSPACVAEQSDILFLCVTNEAICQELLFNAPASVLSAQQRPRTIIDTSTIAPTSAIAFAEQLATHDIAYLDAPVSGGDIGAKNGTLTIMVGGAETAFTEAAPILSAIGSTIIHTGVSGNGQKTKCINQIVVALNVAAMTEGLHLAEAAGLDLSTTLAAIGGGAAGSWSLENYAPRLLAGNFGPGFYARDMLKDLRYALQLAADKNCELPASLLVTELYEELVESDSGSTLGNHALILRYRDQPIEKSKKNS